MAAIVYLNFDGNAKQAIDFYTQALTATAVKSVTFGDMPQNPEYPLPENEQSMIMESSLQFEGGKLMMSDVLPSMKSVTGEWVQGNNMLVTLVLEDKAQLQRYFDRLSEGGIVTMPLSEVPWSSCFGMLIDRFGIHWKFNRDADTFLDRVYAQKQS
ncbi:VOC family protein [Saccharibacillus sp. JS10]|uniref:VOC family protein n=1 Tax=Saccharibacillus sp. JS10 TaxID=2950552 RepID=UPI00210DC29E|nr:VOC family protein [Saccharibacillus sp. JS10]MCQ4087827.1 VOC family protein [Saccharibacillus sp. JS10]